MEYKASIVQRGDTSIDLTVIRNGRRYSTNLTAGEALDLAHRLMSFASAQQDQPYYVLSKELKS